MVFVQKWPFLKLFFKRNIGQEHVFYDILERKNAFLGYKNKKFKTSKNWHFSKGFGQKWPFAQKWPFLKLFFKGNIGQEDVVYDILERKNAFLGQAYIAFKKKLEKWPFLDQNHGLTPLEKCQFFDFWTSCFYSLERRFLVLEYHKRHFPGLYCLKKKSWKNSHFWTKTMG